MLNIGIVVGSTRQGRKGIQVARWLLDHARRRGDANYTLLDLADYPLPFFGAELPAEQKEAADRAIRAWSRAVEAQDGFIFVTPEYNHATSGVLKNALDHVNREIHNKAAGLAGYGGLGGARAIENLRLILGELQVADVRTSATFSIMTDFDETGMFRPKEYHLNNVNGMLDQLLAWSRALRTVRMNLQNRPV